MRRPVSLRSCQLEIFPSSRESPLRLLPRWQNPSLTSIRWYPRRIRPCFNCRRRTGRLSRQRWRNFSNRRWGQSQEVSGQRLADPPFPPRPRQVRRFTTSSIKKFRLSEHVTAGSVSSLHDPHAVGAPPGFC